jgi:hypothetical protein
VRSSVSAYKMRLCARFRRVRGRRRHPHPHRLRRHRRFIGRRCACRATRRCISCIERKNKTTDQIQIDSSPHLLGRHVLPRLFLPCAPINQTLSPHCCPPLAMSSLPVFSISLSSSHRITYTENPDTSSAIYVIIPQKHRTVGE